MKISCIQENLKQGLNIVSNVANKNLNLPILSNVLIDVKDNEIKLSATNLEIGITCSIRGKIEKTGSFTVDAKLLNDYVNLLPKERIDLELIDNQLSIICNNNKTKIKGIDASDFPLIPKIDKKNAYICNSDKFKHAVSQVIFASAKNESRPEICGVLIKVKDNLLTLTATDSYRLAEKKILLENNSFSDDFEVIVPVKTLQEVVRVLNTYKDSIDMPDSINIYVNASQILFEYDVVDIVSRLIEGNYPDYEQIIPNNFETSIIVNILDLVKAVKTASLFSKVGVNDISIEVEVNEKSNDNSNLKIFSTNDQVGENLSIVKAKVQGLNNGIVLNYNFLLDCLNAIDSEDVEIKIIDSSSPCILKPFTKNQTKESYLHIIMPIRQ